MVAFVELFLLLFMLIPRITSEQRQCQAITYYECKNIGYNQTYLPNKFNHQDQKDVALVVSFDDLTLRCYINRWGVNAVKEQKETIFLVYRILTFC